MKIKQIIFDMEMMGLNKNDDTISIGLISLDEEIFYGEINDFDKSNIPEWIQDNVIANLLFKVSEVYESINNEGGRKSEVYKLPFKEMSVKLNNWLEKISEGYDKIQFIADVCHYDFVHLIDLITDKKSALDLNSKIIPDIININQYMSLPVIRKSLNISNDEITFDTSREELYEFITGESIPDMNKHNALYDAFICLSIFLRCQDILGI